MDATQWKLMRDQIGALWSGGFRLLRPCVHPYVGNLLNMFPPQELSWCGRPLARNKISGHLRLSVKQRTLTPFRFGRQSAPRA